MNLHDLKIAPRDPAPGLRIRISKYDTSLNHQWVGLTGTILRKDEPFWRITPDDYRDAARRIGRTDDPEYYQQNGIALYPDEFEIIG